MFSNFFFVLEGFSHSNSFESVSVKTRITQFYPPFQDVLDDLLLNKVASFVT